MADLSITAANVAGGADAVNRQGIAGATITAGQALYQDSADSYKLKPARANAVATDLVVGIALHGAANNQPITYQSAGNINLGATLAVGQVYVLSAAAAGGIAPNADLLTGNFVSVLGVATSASNLIVNITNSSTAKA